MISEDNPYKIHLQPLTSYRQRTVRERIYSWVRAWWFRNEEIRIAVAFFLTVGFLIFIVFGVIAFSKGLVFL